ncbi:MAG: hypothetical protein KDK24_10475 [Pseudooceanicola sp.]|nr:hypothetical protein [Pseudooceanicola sp.]
MRHVDRYLWLFLALTLIAAAVVAVAGRMDYLDETDGIPAIVTGIGAAVLAVLAIVTFLLWKMSRFVRRARRPDQRVASWTVSPDLWARFIELDAARAAEYPAYIHMFKPRTKTPAKGVEVLCAKSGILIDGMALGTEVRGLSAMTGLTWLSGNPETIEFVARVPRGRSGGGIATDPGFFRIPVAPARREEAMTAYNYYRDLLIRGELSDPTGHRLMVRICWLLAAILLPIGALGFWMNAKGIMAGHIAVPLMAMIGTMGGGGAVLVAVVVWYAMLKK